MACACSDGLSDDAESLDNQRKNQTLGYDWRGDREPTKKVEPHCRAGLEMVTTPDIDMQCLYCVYKIQHE